MFNKFSRIKHNNKRAFTIAEMTVVLLILSIVMAAILPVTTNKRTSGSSGGGTLWKLARNNTDIWFASPSSTQSVLMGTSQTPDAKGKLRQEVKYYIELVDANNRGIVFNKDGANLKPKESDQLERVDVAPSSATRSVAVNTTTMPAIAGSTANGGGKVYNHKCYLG